MISEQGSRRVEGRAATRERGVCAVNVACMESLELRSAGLVELSPLANCIRIRYNNEWMRRFSSAYL